MSNDEIDSTKIQITVTISQARAIAKALDLFSRLSIGQVGVIAEAVSVKEIPAYAENGKASRHVTPEVCDTIRENVSEILTALGYSGIGHSLGISSEHVPIDGRRAYEISRSLEKVLAEHRDPAPQFRGVNYDGLRLRYTTDPAPQVDLLKGQ